MVPGIMKKRQMFLFCGPLVLYSLAIILLPARSLSSLQYVFFYYMDLLALGIIIRLIFLIKKKRWIIPKNETVILSVLLFFIFMFSFSGSLDQLFFTGKNIFNRLGLLGFVIATNAFLGIRFINRTEEAENLNERLEKANVAKDAFLEVTMQELKNPLYDAINLMKSVSYRSDDQKNHNHTRQLIFEQLLERFLYLVNDLQDFTRIRFQDFSFELQSTNVSMVVRHVAQLIDFSFSRKQIEFQENIHEKLHVLADEKRLAQVFYRILSESLTYATNGKIQVEAHHVQSVVTINFKATGDVHFATEQSNIMGLSMGKELIEKMNGLLQIDKLENGVHFTVKLPFHEYKNIDDFKQEKEIDTEPWIAASIEGKDQKMVLIVEDDPLHAEVLSSMLSDKYHVIIAYSAQEAIAKLNQELEISLVIVDELMPVMDGIELTRRIRQKASLIELPIIITAFVDYPSNLEAIFSVGANDYLIKPVTKEALLARLSAVEQTIRAINQSVENEMAYLQAQIKPHFLYNALSSIISFCYTDGERAAHLLSMLSSYLRYIFEAGKEGNEASLQKELEIIEAYVEVEKARFGQRLSYSCDIEKIINSNKIKIPSLLLQPLVENAIRHGLFEKEGSGHVGLTISIKDQLLFIQVEDDGVGMTKEQCEQLMEGTMLNRGIGFTNVLRRVQELSNGNLTMDSTFGEGTILTLTIPIKEISKCGE
jgi:sensor histidine kinase YesM